jgi:hypothetical protein
MRENDRSRNNGGGKNGVIYMGLISGPNEADDTCGKTTVTGTMDRSFTVLNFNCLLFSSRSHFDFDFTICPIYVSFFSLFIYIHYGLPFTILIFLSG